MIPFVRGFQAFRDSMKEREGLFDGKRAAGDSLGQRLSLDELHHQELGSVRFLDAEERRDRRMIEGGERLCFSLQAGPAFLVLRERVGKHFDSDLAAELRIPGAIDFSHPADAEESQHFEVP